MDENICPICGHSLVITKNKRVSCPYCEHFYPDTHWADYKKEKYETTNRETENFLKRFIR